jgi:hypothetical protein
VSPADAPSAEQTPAAAPPAAAPSADETPTAAPSAAAPPAAAPSADETPTAAPSADETSAAAPSADETPAAAPSADETPAAAPPADETPTGELPIIAAPTEDVVDAPPWVTARSDRPARRQPMLLQGIGPAVVAAGLAGASLLGTIPFAVAILVLQALLVLAVLALMDAPASGGAFLVAAGAFVAADVAVVVDDGDIRALAGVVALALVASLFHQLTRKSRSRVTESLADTLVVVTLSVSAACLLSLHALDGGDETVVVALVAAGASLLAARIGDRLVARPMLAVGSTRGWPGLLLGLGAGVAAAVVVAGQGGVVVGTQAALLGLVCAATVAAADLAVDLGAAELRAGWRDARRAEALKPASVLLPFALLGPISLVAGHLVLG